MRAVRRRMVLVLGDVAIEDEEHVALPADSVAERKVHRTKSDHVDVELSDGLLVRGIAIQDGLQDPIEIRSLTQDPFASSMLTPMRSSSMSSVPITNRSLLAV